MAKRIDQAIRVSVVRDGVVENIIKAPADAEAFDAYVAGMYAQEPEPERLTFVPDDRSARIGGTWNGRAFTPPPEPEPDPEQQKRAQAQAVINALADKAEADFTDADARAVARATAILNKR